MPKLILCVSSIASAEAHFDLRFAGKQMERMSKKAEQEAKANQAKVKKVGDLCREFVFIYLNCLFASIFHLDSLSSCVLNS